MRAIALPLLLLLAACSEVEVEDVCSDLDEASCAQTDVCIFEVGTDTCTQSCEEGRGCPPGTLCLLDPLALCPPDSGCLAEVVSSYVCRPMDDGQ